MIKIMIVEDEDIIRKGIRAIIDRLGDSFQIICECRDGEDGWADFQKYRPDVVITDIRMRHMSGLELIKKIRSMDESVPIMIISGYSEFKYAQQALRFGVTDYFLKPINVTEFSNALLKIQEKFEPHSAIADVAVESNATIQQIMLYIQEHISEDLSLSILSDALEITPNYISSLFKQETGVNLTSYIMSRRIDKAKNMLRDSRLKVYEISEACGLNNVKYFTSCFKKETGMTPHEYRNSYSKN